MDESIHTVKIRRVPIPHPTTAHRVLHRCLELSNREDWCSSTIQFFDAGKGSPFSQWWKACAEAAFEQPEPYYLHVCSEDDVRTLPAEYMPETDLVVVLNLCEPKHLLVKALKELLSDPVRSPHSGRRGGSVKKEDLSVGFGFIPHRRNWRGCVTALNVLLERLKAPDVPDWKIGLKCGVGLIGVGAPTVDQKASLSSAVSRHLRVARALVRGVEQGIFPARLTDLKDQGISDAWARKAPLPRLAQMRLPPGELGG